VNTGERGLHGRCPPARRRDVGAIAILDAAAGIALHDNHHPDMLPGYDQRRIDRHRAPVGGVSGIQFIYTAKIEAL